jgi:cytochrome c-type biogenesis protein CcmH/NrfG
MPTPDEIEKLKSLPAFATYTAAMEATQNKANGIDLSAGFKTAGARTNELIAEQNKILLRLTKPHWSVTPGFIVGVVAMVAACVAAYYSYLAYAQPQQATPAVHQSEKPTPSGPDTSPSPSKQLPGSQQ